MKTGRKRRKEKGYGTDGGGNDMGANDIAAREDTVESK